GAYIGFGSFQRIGDCGEMLRYGMPIWLLWLFGIAAFSFGLIVWSSAGAYFGFRPDAPQVATRHIVATLVAIVVVAMLGSLTRPAQNDSTKLQSPANKEIQARTQ